MHFLSAAWADPNLDCLAALTGWQKVGVHGYDFYRPPIRNSYKSYLPDMVSAKNDGQDFFALDEKGQSIMHREARVALEAGHLGQPVRPGDDKTMRLFLAFNLNSLRLLRHQYSLTLAKLEDGDASATVLSDREIWQINYLILDSAALFLRSNGIKVNFKQMLFGNDRKAYLNDEVLEISTANGGRLGSFLDELQGLANEANRLIDLRQAAADREACVGHRKFNGPKKMCAANQKSNLRVSLVIAPGRNLRKWSGGFHLDKYFEQGNLYLGVPEEVALHLDPKVEPIVNHEVEHLVTTLKKHAGVPQAFSGSIEQFLPTDLHERPEISEDFVDAGGSYAGFATLDEPAAQLEGARAELEVGTRSLAQVENSLITAAFLARGWLNQLTLIRERQKGRVHWDLSPKWVYEEQIRAQFHGREVVTVVSLSLTEQDGLEHQMDWTERGLRDIWFQSVAGCKLLQAPVAHDAEFFEALRAVLAKPYESKRLEQIPDSVYGKIDASELARRVGPRFAKLIAP